MSPDELRAFLDTEINRVVDLAKEHAPDEGLLAGMVVATLMKSALMLAKTCGVSKEAIAHAYEIFSEEVYK